jgi:hypothetical protein
MKKPGESGNTAEGAFALKLSGKKDRFWTNLVE